MDSFLHQTAVSITTHIPWQQLNRTTLVLPSHRAGVVLKNELLSLQQQAGQKAVWAPQVLTLQQLQDALSPLYPEDELMTIVRLYRLYRQQPAADSRQSGNDLMPLDMFYGWGRQMLADFTNIDASMHAEEVPNFFANTIAAHELSQWQLEPETETRLRGLLTNNELRKASEDSVRQQYEYIWHQLYELYKALHAEMESERKGYSGMRQRSVIEHWNDDPVQQQIAGRTFIFVGFNYLLPVERELMELLRDNQQALFYWDYVPCFRTNEKAFSFAERNSALLGNAMPPEPQRAKHFPSIAVGSCVSRESQAQYVHQWLRDNYTAKGERVGVVICDENMLESVIYALPAITIDGGQPEPVNITKGFPLRNTQVFAKTLSWLSDRARGNAETIVSPDFIDQLSAYLFETADLPDTPETTESLSWQELLILESEYQVRKIINQMRLLIATGLDDVPFTLKLLRLLMRRTMESVTMPFHGEPMTDIQVMGVLETRMLDFDKLLLLHVEEGVIPQRQQDISFIPFYLRKAYHMQTADERATVYAYNFFRLLSRAGETTMLFTSADTADGGKGLSRFVMQILVSPEFRVTKFRLQEPGIVSHTPLTDDTHASDSLLSQLHVDTRGRVLRSSGRPYRLSPSALNTYITCPYNFYLQYILGLQPQEKEDALYAPNTLGSFVHHTLEYIYRTYMACDNSAPRKVTHEQIESVRADQNRLQQALEAAYDAMNREWLCDHPDEPEHYRISHHPSENIIILGYVDNVLQRDAADALTGLQICLLEQERTLPLEVERIGTVETGGTIDRLDIQGEEGNQRLRVVDYKSGSYNDKTHDKKMSAASEELFSLPEKGYVRQTMMYSCAVARHSKENLPVEPNLYFCRRKLTDIDTTISIDNQPVSDVRVLQNDFLKALSAKVHEILTATSFPRCAESDCPSFCPFKTLCGRAQTY
ncbi:MAG: PD-(D/E)XK nuclease family protein [Paludibacteraceae bacterium]|nr:PD-(D/E)XK nuclease family protein [Paludibacteraceae bacterium]